MQELPPDVVRKLLKGHVSSIPALAERDQELRTEIAARSCPRCGAQLVPKIPKDPSKVFRTGGGIRYDAVCPAHGAIA